MRNLIKTLPAFALLVHLPAGPAAAQANPYTKVCNSGQQAGTGACPANAALGAAPNQWGCTIDNKTGLMWEVKTQAGPRGYGKTYTSFDNPALPQKSGGMRPTPAEIAAPSNVMGYLAAVNGAGLCGKSDWRRPTHSELFKLVSPNPAPNTTKINQTFFPWTGYGHPALLPYTTTTPAVGSPNDKLYMVNFYLGQTAIHPRDHPSHVRLVTTSGQQCQTLTIDESTPWNAAAAITLPGLPKKVVSVTGSYTVAAANGNPAQTLSITLPPPNQPRTGPFNLAYQNKHIFSVMLIPGVDALPPNPGSGYANYLTIGQPVRSGSYLHHGTSLVNQTPPTQAVHGKVTGSVTICVA